MPYWCHISAYLLFTVFILVFFSGFYGQLTPADAVAYVSIAEKYASGQFSTAVNAYWSPLFCWLLAVQLKMGISADTALFSIKLFAGVATIFLSGNIINCYHWPLWAKAICLHLLALWSALFTLQFATPDSFMAAGLLLYLYLLIKGWWVKYPLLTGLLGAVLYFTKAFGFYFFPAYLLFLLAWKLFTSKRSFRFLVRQTVIVLFSFSAAILPWLLAVHYRYNKWIISSASGYNHSLMLYGDGSVQPALKSGLLPLSNESAYNPWEEITLVYPFSDWSPFQSSTMVMLQVRVVLRNLHTVLWHLRSIHLLICIALVVGLLFTGWFVIASLRGFKMHFSFRTSVYVLSFISLYTLGYSIAGIDHRYLYIVYIGMFFVFFDLLVILKNRFPKMEFLCLLLAVGLIVQNVYQLSKFLYVLGIELKKKQTETRILQKIIPPGSLVATHATNTTNAMDYRGKWHNHGGLEAYQNRNDAQQALLRYHIQWVLIPVTEQQHYTWLQLVSDTMWNTSRWKIFKLKIATAASK